MEPPPPNPPPSNPPPPIQQSSLCSTIGGRDVPLLTITAPPTNEGGHSEQGGGTGGLNGNGENFIEGVGSVGEGESGGGSGGGAAPDTLEPSAERASEGEKPLGDRR